MINNPESAVPGQAAQAGKDANEMANQKVNKRVSGAPASGMPANGKSKDGTETSTLT